MNEMNDWLELMGLWAIALCIFLLSYRLTLYQSTHFHLRRVFLIVAGVMALLISKIDFPPLMEWTIELPQTAFIPEQPETIASPENQTQQGQISLMSMLGKLYLLGCFLMIIRFVIMAFQIIRIRIKASHSGIRDNLFYSDLTEAPLTFLTAIILPRKQQESPHKEAILIHEQAHIDYGHYCDLILFELFLLVQWFNPLTWWMKKELATVQEYQADQYVLDHSIQKKSYQLAILECAVGRQKFALASAFNHLQTLKRIQMMNQKRSSSLSKAFVLCLVPVGLLCLALMSGFKSQEPTFPVPVDEIIVKGKVVKANSQEPLAGVAILLKDSQIGTLTDQEGNFYISIPNEQGQTLIFTFVNTDSYEIPISQSGELGVELAESSSGSSHKFQAKAIIPIPPQGENAEGPILTIIDGKEMKPKDIKDINPADIESMEVLKPEDAKSKYGEKGKNGVIIITTKKK